MSDIVQLYDASNNAVYPVTHLKSVRDSSGTTLESMMQDVREITVGYYECSTSGNIAAKTITIDSSVYLSTKILCKVKFVEKNTAANATLNINQTGAKPLYYNGVRVSTNNSWYAGEIVTLFYDGSAFQLNSLPELNEYDVSAKNPTGGPNSDGKFTLAYILSNANTLIPTSVRKGGMSIKFVLSSDNKYVQYRLMLSTFTAAQFTNTANWQGVGDTPTAGSDNLVKSDGIARAILDVITEHDNYTFDLTNLQTALLYSSNGNIWNQSSEVNKACPDYLPVKEGQIVHFIGIATGSAKGLCCYNASKQYISSAGTVGVDNATGTDYTIPAGVSFIRVCTEKYTTYGLSCYIKKASERPEITAIQDYITSISSGLVYAGIATPSTTPVVGKYFYIAYQAGTYTNFDNLTVSKGINTIKRSGNSWVVESLVGITANPTKNAAALVEGGGVYSAIEKISYPSFIKIFDGDLSDNEKKVLDAIKGIRVYGNVLQTEKYFIRKITRNVDSKYEITLAKINYAASQTNIVTLSLPSSSVSLSNNVAALVFTDRKASVIIAIDFGQIEDGGSIDISNLNPKYCIEPSCVVQSAEKNLYSTSTPASVGSIHYSTSDSLNVSIKNGDSFTVFINGHGGVLGDSNVEVIATYSDNTTATIYIGKLFNKYISLTAESDIINIGVYWNASAATTTGYVEFGVFVNSLDALYRLIASCQTNISNLSQRIINQSYKLVKVVSGTPTNDELKMLSCIKDIQLVGDFNPNKRWCVEELTRNRNSAYEIILGNVAADGTESRVVGTTVSIPSSKVTEGSGYTKLTYPIDGMGDVNLTVDFSIINDGGIINLFGSNLKYIIPPTSIIYKSVVVSKPYFPEDMDKYDTSVSAAKTYIPTTPPIEHKYSGQVTPEKRYMCIGFDDLRESDISAIMPLFEKYGFKASFNAIFYTANIESNNKSQINAIVYGGHEIGDHTWKHYNYPFTEPLWNGQDPDNPDGSQIAYPSNSQFRDDAGDGKNAFGRLLTQTMAQAYPTESWRPPVESTKTWGTLSDADCQAIREYFSVIKDTDSNLITVLDSLSNKYLGTTGSSNGSWDDTLEEYTGGIFTGCKTSANHEIWERILEVTEMYYREQGGINFKIKTWSYPGSKISGCYYRNDGKSYYDDEHTKLMNYLAKFTSSLTNKERSWVDVLRTHGYTNSHDFVYPGRNDGTPKHCIAHQFVLNSKGRKNDDLVYPTTATNNYQYDEIDSAFNNTYKNAIDMYDSPSSSAFRTFIEAARRNMSNGLIDVEATDSTTSYSMMLFYEGLLKYCKATGVELITKSEAFDICFNHSIEDGNLIYNRNLRNTAKEFMPTANVPTNPDGYTTGCAVEYDSDNTPILSTTSNVSYCHYGIPNGKIKYSANFKGNGSVVIYAIKNSSNYDHSNESVIAQIANISSDTFVSEEVEFAITDNAMEQYDQLYEGYGDKIIGIRIVYSGGLRVKNIRLEKLT